MPYDLFINASTGCLKPDAELKAAFESRGVDLGKQTVLLGNHGVTACIVDLAWNIAGGKKAAVHDVITDFYKSY